MGRKLHAAGSALGARIRSTRGDSGLAETAADLGITHTTLSRIERGASKPSAETARALARWLGWTIEEVLDAAETQNPP